MIEDVNNFNVLTNDIEKQNRKNLYDNCEHNKETQADRICFLCACPIEYVITYQFKECPIQKWTV